MGKNSKIEWETQTTIEVGWRVWFYLQGESHSGYVRKVNDDQTFRIAVYYIGGVALGRYEIVDKIHRLDIYRWEKKMKRKHINAD